MARKGFTRRQVPAGVQTLVFTVNSFTGQNFSSVENAFCRIVDRTNGQEIARYDLSSQGNHTAQVMARVYRDNAGVAVRPDLRKDEYLLLEEILSPTTGLAADADAKHRQVLLIGKVENTVDPAFTSAVARSTASFASLSISGWSDVSWAFFTASFASSRRAFTCDEKATNWFWRWKTMGAVCVEADSLEHCRWMSWACANAPPASMARSTLSSSTAVELWWVCASRSIPSLN